MTAPERPATSPQASSPWAGDQPPGGSWARRVVGQLTVIAGAFLAVGLWFRNRPWYRNAIARPASALIALVALYWTVERVFF